MNFVRKKRIEKETHKASDIDTVSHRIDLMQRLQRTTAFDKDWVLYVLEELVLQCIGKAPIRCDIIKTKKGEEKVWRYTYNAKEAVRGLELGAEISGLMQTKGKTIIVNNQNKVESIATTVQPSIPTSDIERVEAVYEILKSADAFKAPLKLLPQDTHTVLLEAQAC